MKALVMGGQEVKKSLLRKSEGNFPSTYPGEVCKGFFCGFFRAFFREMQKSERNFPSTYPGEVRGGFFWWIFSGLVP